jgi:hypothetical protein
LTFSPPVREQLVIERMARLFDIEPLGGQLGAYVDQAMAPGNAKALRQLCSGSSAAMDLPVMQRPTKVPKNEPSPPSSDVTYQRIVTAVRVALRDAGMNPSIGQLDTDPSLYTSAIENLRRQVEDYLDTLKKLKDELPQTETSASEFDALPGIVRKLTARVRVLEAELEDCNYDKENFKSRSEEYEGKYAILEREHQRLTEESNQQHLAQQLADIDIFDDEPFLSSDQGAL